jgi:hypothetical protein
MEKRIIMLEKRIDSLDEIIQSQIHITKSITSFMSDSIDLFNKSKIEHDGILKKFTEIDYMIEMLMKLREGDLELQKLNNDLNKFKK